MLIEALACGTPILCCRRRPMTDICGDAAVLFDGEDPDEIADKIFEVLSDPSLREALSRRAVERATQFSWQKGAEKVHRLFEQLAPAPRAAGRACRSQDSGKEDLTAAAIPAARPTKIPCAC